MSTSPVSAAISGLPESPVLWGHLWCTQLENGLWLNLDAKLRTASGEVPVFRAPALTFPTNDIDAAFAYMQAQGVELVTEICNGIKSRLHTRLMGSSRLFLLWDRVRHTGDRSLVESNG